MAKRTISDAMRQFAHDLASHGIELHAVALKNPIDGDRFLAQMNAEVVGMVNAGHGRSPSNEAQIYGITIRWPDAGYLKDGKLKWPGSDY